MSDRLLSVERKTRMSGDTTLELKTAEISPSFSVRLLEPGLPGKVDRFLDIISAGREADVRQMAISTAGSGEHSCRASRWGCS